MWRGLAAHHRRARRASSTPTPRTSTTRFVLGLLGPLLTDPTSPSSRATSGARSSVGDTTHPDGGGRVTELLARPYLNLHFPELAGFRQPLAGEIAADARAAGVDSRSRSATASRSRC